MPDSDITSRPSEAAGASAELSALRERLFVSEQRCRDAEAERNLLASVFESARDAIWIWKADGTITAWNAQAERLLGYAATEIVGKSLLTLVPPERQAVAGEAMAKLRDGGWYGQYETVRLRRDGGRLPVELTVSPVRDPSGAVAAAATFCRDISERRKVEDLLSRRMKELAALYRLADRLQRTVSLQGICRAALDAIAAALGCERASILLLDEHAVMRFVAWRGLSESYRAAVDGHSPWDARARNPAPICIPDIELADEPDALKRVVHAEGIRALAFIPLVSRGKLIGKFMTYYRSIHAFERDEIDVALTIARQLSFSIQRQRADAERSRAEALLLESERRFKTLTAEAPVGIFETDPEGHCLYVNERWCRLAGLSAGEAAGHGWTDAIHPEDRRRVSEDWYRCAREGSPFLSEYRFRTPSGTVAWLKGSAQPMRDEKGAVRGYIGSVMDITDHKLAAQRQMVLINELNHRVKNTLATVQAIAAQTARADRAGPEVQNALEARLLALSAAHGVLTEQRWEGADIRDIVAQCLLPHAPARRIRIEGPTIRLCPKAAVAIAMGIHELATNALKYGSLSNEAGKVDLLWRVSQPDLFRLEWKETGGPPVRPPERRGFGSRLIERTLAHDLDGRISLRFEPQGVTCTIEGSLASIDSRSSDSPMSAVEAELH
jgi:PAS domain S-box-containing protein